MLECAVNILQYLCLPGAFVCLYTY